MTTKDKTIEALRELAIGSRHRSETDLLREIIDEVEATFKAGISRRLVLSALHENYGFKMSMSGFEKALATIRKERKQQPSVIEASDSSAQSPSQCEASTKTVLNVSSIGKTETKKVHSLRERRLSQESNATEINNFLTDLENKQ